jgi:methylation protein EvaC
MDKCRACNSGIQPFMSFGKQPIANGFLGRQEFGKEYFFEMQVAFCGKCGMVQLTDQPEAEMMFHGNYAFFSGTSSAMQKHFEGYAAMVKREYLKDADPFVVEIGSNDGILMINFAKDGIRHLGVEPSTNVADVARKRGINTISKFFNRETAAEIVAGQGKADAFMAANVMCHIPFIHSVIEGIGVLLKDRGVAIFEEPYLGDVLAKTSYDQLYDEHVFLFSLTSIGNVFAQHGFELIDALPQETHGGSMRYVLARKGARPVGANVGRLLKAEKDAGLDKPETYAKFKASCEKSKRELTELLRDLKAKGKRVVGYAATSKSTTVLNYCGISPDLLEFISDTTPIKQGKFTPGTHIPVRSHDEFAGRYPDYALLFGWNHAKEIMAKEQAFKDAGGKWITYVPQVGILA